METERRRCSKCQVKLNRYNRFIAKAKQAARSELKTDIDWRRLSLAESSVFSHLFKEPESHLENSNSNVPRIEYSAVGRKEFRKRWEKKGRPVIIKGAMDGWPALKLWTIEELLKTYPDEKFKVGEDDDEKVVYLALKYYLHYAVCMSGDVDDSPLYIFDANFGKRHWHHSARRPVPSKSKSKGGESSSSEDEGTSVTAGKKKKKLKKRHKYDPRVSQAPCHLVEDYKVPKYFEHDLFMHVGGRRPPFRWVVIGPARSGTSIHIDPLGTSAWNSLISGHKRWCLFPPTTDKALINPKLKDHEASTWFSQVYPKLQEPSKNDSSLTLGQELGMIEAVQCPGETMFVPGGWHHIVMNLDFAIAVTQNFCSLTNVESVYLKTRFARPKLSNTLNRILKRPPSAVKSRREVKRMRASAEDLEGLRTVPALDTSSSNSSSSSSSSDTGTDSDAHVVCLCHGRKRTYKNI